MDVERWTLDVLRFVMRVTVINTGTELLLGQVLNTHLRFIAQEIFLLGLRVAEQSTVPDGLPIRHAIERTFAKADIVFVTGGLGPTTDDITRDIAAELLGLELKRDSALVSKITERLRTRGFPMTERILRQAEVPDGAVVLPNQNGTAPGLYLRTRSTAAGQTPHLFLLPGPPRELCPMFEASVLPILRKIAPGHSGVALRNFRLAGVGESVVEAAVGLQLLALPGIELGYCARPGEVDVRVLGPEQTLAEAEAIVRAAFPDSFYTAADESLEEVVVRLLAKCGATLAVAESCTGGHLADRITDVPGASVAFVAGYVTYANEAKVAGLDVDPELIRENGAVSSVVARAMAEGARKLSGSTHALATTGIAGPNGGSDQKPVGTVFIALASPDGETVIEKRRYLTDRETFKHLASQTALEMLRRRLIAESP